MSSKINLLIHLKEIKYRFFYFFIAATLTIYTIYIYTDAITYFIMKPLLVNGSQSINRLIYTNITEAFFSYIYIYICMATLITLPLIYYHIYYFIISGLYKKEQQLFLYVLSFSLFFYFMGSMLTYSQLIPLAWNFFLEYDTGANLTSVFNISFEGKINEYLGLFFKFFISISFLTQIPLIIYLLIFFKLLSVKILTNLRSFLFILSFIIGAIGSPPDVFSQVCLAIPLYISFELGIFFGFYIKYKDINNN